VLSDEADRKVGTIPYKTRPCPTALSESAYTPADAAWRTVEAPAQRTGFA